METEKIHNFSMGKKVALWLAIVWLVFCLLGALGNGSYSITVVCIALLAVILCLFKRILDAKYTWIVFAFSLFLPFVMFGALASPDDENSKQGIEKEELSKEIIQSEDSKKTFKETTKKVDKKQELHLSSKEKEIADAGYNKGTLAGYAATENEEFSNMLDLAEKIDGMEDKMNEMIEQMAGQEYDKAYNAPTNAVEEKMRKIYIEYFIKGMEETMESMDNLEKLGGKRK